MRTFNASASHNIAGFQKTIAKHSTLDCENSPTRRDLIDQEHAATIDSKLLEVDKRMD